ncbi:MAG: c-type cytochrome [Chitinophagaceae bacterium]|nr:c-type cytochrome [Chitinophagaceae bacterium]
MRKQIAFLFLLSFLLLSYQADLFQTPAGFPKPVYDFTKNPLDSAKIELGRALFYDPILSHNLKISCASCHSPYNAFAHVDHALSHGIDDRIGKRNAPALFNLAWHNRFMWDGAIHHLDVQALAPMSHPDEMGDTLAHVIAKLQATTLYPSLYEKAFGDRNITGEHTLKAIAQFLLTLVSANSKYDSVLRHQATFTDQENNGYKLFQQHCSSCHTEPLFTNGEFESNGLPPDTFLQDKGRMAITHRKEDSLRFKVPSLRNIEFTFPYMHDGRFKQLREVLQHYSGGIQTDVHRDKLQRSIPLKDNEKVDIIAFLLTLSDRSFMFNPKFAYPKILFQKDPQEK